MTAFDHYTRWSRFLWWLFPLRIRRIERDWIVEAEWRGNTYQWMFTMDGLTRL